MSLLSVPWVDMGVGPPNRVSGLSRSNCRTKLTGLCQPLSIVNNSYIYVPIFYHTITPKCPVVETIFKDNQVSGFVSPFEDIGVRKGAISSECSSM